MKAVGTGLNFDLQKLSFVVNSPMMMHSQSDAMITDSVLFIEGRPAKDWTFEETLLDNDHWVSTALLQGLSLAGKFDALNCQSLIENLQDEDQMLEQSDEWSNFQEKIAMKPF